MINNVSAVYSHARSVVSKVLLKIAPKSPISVPDENEITGSVYSKYNYPLNINKMNSALVSFFHTVSRLLYYR